MMKWYRILILNVVLEIIGVAFIQAESREFAELHCEKMNWARKNLTVVQEIHSFMLPPERYLNRLLEEEEYLQFMDPKQIWFR